MGYINEFVKNLERKDDPAEALLSYWETESGHDVKKLIGLLNKIQRNDVIELMQQGNPWTFLFLYIVYTKEYGLSNIMFACLNFKIVLTANCVQAQSATFIVYMTSYLTLYMTFMTSYMMLYMTSVSHYIGVLVWVWWGEAILHSIDVVSLFFLTTQHQLSAPNPITTEEATKGYEN